MATDDALSAEAAGGPFARVVRVAATGSTNTDLREAAAADPGAWPHLSVLVAEHQTAGRGRTGRAWQTPPGVALTASILLRPDAAPARVPLAPLVVGLAVQRALARLVDRPVGIKWPNDVVVRGAGPAIDDWGTDRKVAGVLVEALAVRPGEGAALVVGLGVNVAQTAEQLPVPWATSLALAAAPAAGAGPSSAAGAIASPAAVLHAVGTELRRLIPAWRAGDPTLIDAVRAACVTLGRAVRVERPDGSTFTGVAEALADDGHLVVRTAAGERVDVVAGDVLHVRRA